MVFVLTNRFQKDKEQYNKNIVIKLPFATNSSIEIAEYATLGLQKIFKEGFAYKKAGVVIMDFIPEENYQLNIFNNSNPKHKQLMQTMDSINRKMGQNKIKLASQDLKKMWKMKQEKLSPRYTTQLSDIIRVKCN
jgi:DNA polymerase V